MHESKIDPMFGLHSIVSMNSLEIHAIHPRNYERD